MSSTTAAMEAGSTHRTLAVVLAGFCAFLTLFATQPLLPELARVFHASQVAVSLTVTAATLGVAFAAPLIGTVADRLGRKRVIVWSAYLLSVATLLAATSTNLPTLLFWRFVAGVCTPGVFAVTVAYIQEEFTAGTTGSATAAYVSGTVLGGFLSRLASGLIAANGSWRWSFLVLGIVGLLSATALNRWLPQERRFVHRTQTHSTMAAAWDHLCNRDLLATFLAGSCLMFALLGSFTYVTFYLAAPPFHLGTVALGSLFFVYLVSVVVTPRAGRWIDQYGDRRVMAIASVTAIVGLLLTLSDSLPMVVTGLALVCTGIFVTQSCTNSHIGRAAQHNTALAVGLYVTFYYAGGSVGSWLSGFVWYAGGWPACVALFCAVQAAAALLAWRFWPSSGQ